MAQDVVVETRNLTKVYRDFWGRRKKTALNALNIQIERGEIFGLLGPNGSGKTTTIKLLLGLLFPTTGEAFVFGQPTLNVDKNERIGYLPEESYLYRFLNAEETLDFYGRLFNMTPDVRRNRSGARVELRASGVGLTDELRQDLQAVIQRHGGKLESYGHPTTTLEDLFLRIVAESKAHPGRRYLPGRDEGAAAGDPRAGTPAGDGRK